MLKCGEWGKECTGFHEIIAGIPAPSPISTTKYLRPQNETQTCWGFTPWHHLLRMLIPTDGVGLTDHDTGSGWCAPSTLCSLPQHLSPSLPLTLHLLLLKAPCLPLALLIRLQAMQCLKAPPSLSVSFSLLLPFLSPFLSLASLLSLLLFLFFREDSNNSAALGFGLRDLIPKLLDLNPPLADPESAWALNTKP